MKAWLRQTILSSDLSEGDRDYLLARGAKSSTIDRIQAITFEPPVEPCPDPNLAKKFGDHWEWFEGKILLPVYTIRGELLGFDSRTADKKDPLRFIIPGMHWNVPWIGMPFAMERIWAGKPVWVVEGYFDYFSLEHVVEEDAILGSGPAHLSYKHVEFLRRWKPPMVNMCFDRDEAGYKGSAQAISDLTRLRVTCREVPYGKTGVDPGDLWTRGGSEALREAFSRFI